MSAQQLTACLNVMRRMPPADIENNLSGLISLVPDATDELLQRVDQPLQEATDPSNGRKYLLCDYNRDGDSYRSPWSNTYDPAITDGEGFTPSDQLRQLEIQMNEVFDAYRELYYSGGTSSVYMWDLDEGFAGCFLIKKTVGQGRFVHEGSWDSIHVLEVHETSGGMANYKLTTTIMLTMKVKKPELGDSNLSGSLTRQKELNAVLSETQTHVVNMGKMIEDMEIEMRSNLDQLYIAKTQQVVNNIRKLQSGPSQGSAFVSELNQSIFKHAATKSTE